MSTMNLAFSDFSHGRAAVGTTQLHYRAAGEGDAVILLHGWPQHSLQWHAIAPRLAETHRVIVPDLPGCGGSSIPRDGYDKRTIAAIIRELIVGLDVGPVKLVGYDHGAGVAYNYAAAHPDEVTHLAFVEYVLPGCGYEKAMLPTPEWHTGSNWQLAFFTVPDVAEFAFRGRERELLTWFFWHGSCNPASVSQEHLDEYVDQISKPGALRPASSTTPPSGRTCRSTPRPCGSRSPRPPWGSADGTTSRNEWLWRSRPQQPTCPPQSWRTPATGSATKTQKT